MSLRPFAPHHYGVILRQDPTTGAFLSPVWAADEVLEVTMPVSGQVAQHPVQRGGLGPSDVRIRNPETLNVQLRVVNALSLQHPRIDWVESRAERAVAELREIVDAGEPVSVLVRGFDLLRDYVIENAQIAWAREQAEAQISLTLTRVRQVTLALVPVEQDADLLAQGSQLQATIGVFPSA